MPFSWFRGNEIRRAFSARIADRLRPFSGMRERGHARRAMVPAAAEDLRGEVRPNRPSTTGTHEARSHRRDVSTNFATGLARMRVWR
jgi:hypothetical protein